MKAKKEPKSICVCGHTGDGENSQHTNTLQPGHGSCMVKGCNCFWFTWYEFTPKHLAEVKARRGEGR